MEHLLLSYYLRGLIPGPNESKEAFLKRADQSPPRTNEAAILAQVYGCAPDWIVIERGSKGLMPWEAGCVKIDDEVRLQLHPKRKQAIHKEIIAHEAMHAIRCAFHESRFEEILAYKTSSNSFRRFFGPLFQKPHEAKLFLLAALIDSVLIFLGAPYMIATLLIFSVFSSRLLMNQYKFAACLQNLKDLRLTLALTDAEIVKLGAGCKFIDLDDGSLRWKSIKSFAAWLSEGKDHCDI